MSIPSFYSRLYYRMYDDATSLLFISRLHTSVRAIRQTQVQIRKIKMTVQENLHVTRKQLLHVRLLILMKYDVSISLSDMLHGVFLDELGSRISYCNCYLYVVFSEFFVMFQ